nr:MAG TPA: hypothetical protein [Bacteriophage sp.]
MSTCRGLACEPSSKISRGTRFKALRGRLYQC